MLINRPKIMIFNPTSWAAYSENFLCFSGVVSFVEVLLCFHTARSPSKLVCWTEEVEAWTSSSMGLTASPVELSTGSTGESQSWEQSQVRRGVGYSQADCERGEASC